MKIGKFVEINNLTIDTVRHYMDMNLIIPEKLGGQYDFDDKCQKDFEEIMSGYIDKGGKYESYFKEGEKVYSYLMHGKR